MDNQARVHIVLTPELCAIIQRNPLEPQFRFDKDGEIP